MALVVISLLSSFFTSALSQSADTTVISPAKKSIFPTANATRVDNFLFAAFEPLIETELERIANDEDIDCGVPSKFRFTSGFELHSPFAPYHKHGGFHVRTLERCYSDKWQNLMSSKGRDKGWYYDAILDNSMAFWVTNLADYDGYNEDAIDRLYFKWDFEGKTYYSMFIHNKQFRGDLNQFELISDTYDQYINKNEKSSNQNGVLKMFVKENENDENDENEKQNDNLNDNDSDRDSDNQNNDEYEEEEEETQTTPVWIETEARAYIDDKHANYKLICQENSYSIHPIGIRRAVSDLQTNVEWYQKIFVDVIQDYHGGIGTDANGNQVKYGHIMLDSNDGFTVSFFERTGIKTSFGELSIENLETNLNKAHSNVMLNPFCCVDRWYDFHYAIPFNKDYKGLSVLKNIMKSGDRYTVYKISEPDNEETLDFEGSGRRRRLLTKEDDEDTAGDIGTFWIIVEPNGQMAQIPGPTINVVNGRSSSGSILKFFTDIAFWDGDWCAVGNRDRYNQYEFGEEIAIINYEYDHDHEAYGGAGFGGFGGQGGFRAETAVNFQEIKTSNNGGTRDKMNIIGMVILGAVLIIGIAVTRCKYWRNRKNNDKNNQIIRLPLNGNKTDDNEVEYVYKTFE